MNTWLCIVMLLLVVSPARSSDAAQCLEYEIRANRVALGLIHRVPTDAELIGSAVWLMAEKFDLPFPAPVKVHICDDDASIVDRLTQISGSAKYDPWRPLAAGIVTEAGIFYRGDYLTRAQPVDRAGLIVHELAHLAQQELAGKRRLRLPAWIVEGHAEWIRFKVLDVLGYRPYDQSRAEVVHSLAVLTNRPPDLGTLESNGDWWARLGEVDEAAMYGQAFLAVEWLIERYGRAKVLALFELSGLDAVPQASWRRILPVSYEYFVGEFRAYIENVRMAKPRK